MKSAPGNNTLEEELLSESFSFEFFQAVRLLQALQPELSPVGHFFAPQNEAVSFRVNHRLGFPASSVQEIEDREDRGPEMTVNFMGLTGPSGVLPYTYTEHMLERLRAKDTTTESFFDIFNHRMISLFYRAWQKNRLPVTFGTGDDLFTQYLLDLLGLGTPGLQERMAVPDGALLHYLGLFALQSRSAAALEQILADYFEVPVQVEQFRGAWYNLDRGTQCDLEGTDDHTVQLGGGAVVGDAVWDQQSRVRIKLGPMSLPRYSQFLPGGAAHEPIKAITRFFSNDEVDFEVQLILERDDTPRCKLDVDAEDAPQLGWATWLKSEPMNRDPSDTILNL